MPTMVADTRYAAAADRLRAAIAAGTYPAGAKLPSVRSLAASWDLAINTVVAAYRLLEQEGVVASFPRSGFSVLPPRDATPPRTPPRVEAPAPIDLGDVILRTWKLRNQPGIAALGTAIPHKELLPLAALQRHLAAVQRDEPDACFGYDTVPGRPELRRIIAQRLAQWGAPVDPEQVVVTNGAQEALHLALRAVCPPGSCVAVESPAYHGLIQAIGSLGLTCLEIPSSSTGGISLDALRLALDEHEVAAVLCTATFSNPGGGCVPPEGKRELVAICAQHGVPLIDDDTYGESSHDGGRPPLCIAHDRAGMVLHIGSFSKSIAPGLRLGFLVAGRFLKAVQVHKITANIATAVLPQLAVARLLASGDFDRHRRRTAPLLRQAMLRCAAAVRTSFPAGSRVSQPCGGLVLWIEMPAAVDANRLYQEALRAGVCIAPGPLFSARKRYQHHIRVTGGWWDDSIGSAIARLGALATHLAGRPAA